MEEIVNRLYENRQIELAKSILEDNGYKVEKEETLYDIYSVEDKDNYYNAAPVKEDMTLEDVIDFMHASDVYPDDYVIIGQDDDEDHSLDDLMRVYNRKMAWKKRLPL